MIKTCHTKYKIWTKTIAMVIVCLFIVNDISFALSPSVTSSDIGEQLHPETRKKMVDLGQELLTNKRGPCAIDFTPSGAMLNEEAGFEAIIDSRPGLRELVDIFPQHSELLIELSSPNSLGIEALRMGSERDQNDFSRALDGIESNRGLLGELASDESLGMEVLRAGFVNNITGFDMALDSISARREIFDKLIPAHVLGLGALRTVFRDNPWGIYYVLDELYHSYELFDELIAPGSIGVEALRARFLRNPLRFANGLMTMHLLDRLDLRSLLPLFHRHSFIDGLTNLRNLTMHKEYTERMAILSAASSIIMLRLNKDYNKLSPGDCTAITLTYLAKLLDNDPQSSYDDLDKIVERCILHKEVFNDQATAGGKIHLDIDIDSGKARAIMSLASNLDINTHVYSEAAARIGNLELRLQPTQYTAGLNDIIVSFIKLGIFNELDLIGVKNMAVGEDGRPVEYPKTILLQPTLRVDGQFWDEKSELKQEPRLMALGLLLSDPYDVEYKDKIPDEIDTYGPIIEGGGILYDSQGNSEIHDKRSRADLWGIARIGPSDVSAIEAGEDAAFSKVYERYHVLGSAILAYMRNKDKALDEISSLDLDVSSITRSFLDFMKDALLKLELYEAFVGESWNKGNWPKLKKLLESVGIKKGIRAKLEMVEINDGEYRPEIVLAAKKDKNARALSDLMDEVLDKYIEEMKLAHIIDFARRLKSDDSLELEERVSLVYDALEAAGFTLGNELEAAKFHSALETALTLGLDIQYEEIEFEDDLNSDGDAPSDAIGKFVEIEPIKLDHRELLQGVIENIDTKDLLNLSTISQERAPPEDVQEYVGSVERLLEETTLTIPQRELLNSIITQFKAKPPKDIIITRGAEAGFFGIGKPGLLVIDQSLLNNPISFLHEMVEYLKHDHPKMIDQIQSFLDDSANEWIRKHDNKYAGTFGYFKQNNAHYVIRAFTRQLFGDKDRKLTRDIKYLQLFEWLKAAAFTVNKAPQNIRVMGRDLNTSTDISDKLKSIYDNDLGFVVKLSNSNELVLVEMDPSEKAAVYSPGHFGCLSCDIRARRGNKIVIGHAHIFPGTENESDDRATHRKAAFEKYRNALHYLTDSSLGLSDIQIAFSPSVNSSFASNKSGVSDIERDAGARGIKVISNNERPDFHWGDTLNSRERSILRSGSLHRSAKSEFHVTEWAGSDSSGDTTLNSAVNSKSVTKPVARLTTTANVSCGTICEAGHEGSYEALDEQLKRQFDQLRKSLGVAEKVMLTETDADMALRYLYPQFAKKIIVDPRFRGNDIGVTNELQNLRETLRKGAKIPNEISIFFSIPEDGTELFWVGDDYAAAHCNKEGSRIHISLPFLRKTGTDAAIAVARHELIHIHGGGHKYDKGYKLVKNMAEETIIDSRPGLRELVDIFPEHRRILIRLSSQHSLGMETLLAGYKNSPDGFVNALYKIYTHLALFHALLSPRKLGIEAVRAAFKTDPEAFGITLDAISLRSSLFDKLITDEYLGKEALRGGYKKYPMAFAIGMSVLDSVSNLSDVWSTLRESLGAGALIGGFMRNPLSFARAIETLSSIPNLPDILSKLQDPDSFGIEAIRVGFEIDPYGFAGTINMVSFNPDIFKAILSHDLMVKESLRAVLERNPTAITGVFHIKIPDFISIRHFISILPLFYRDNFAEGLTNLRNLMKQKDYSDRITVLSMASFVILMRLYRDHKGMGSGDYAAITLTYLTKLMNESGKVTYQDLDEIANGYILSGKVFANQTTAGGKIHLSIDPSSEKAKAVARLAHVLCLNVQDYSWTSSQKCLEVHLPPSVYTAALTDAIEAFIKLGVFTKLDLLGVNEITVGEDGLPRSHLKTIALQPSLKVSEPLFWTDRELREEPRLMALGLLLANPYDVEYKDEIPKEIDTYGPIVEGGGILYDGKGQIGFYNRRIRADLWGVARISQADVDMIGDGKHTKFSKTYERYHLLGNAILRYNGNAEYAPADMSPLDADLSIIARSFLNFMKGTLIELELYEAFVSESWNKGNWTKLKRLLELVEKKKGVKVNLNMIEVADGEYKPEVLIADKKDRKARTLSEVMDEVLDRYIEDIKLAHVIDYARRIKADTGTSVEEKAFLVRDALLATGFTHENPFKAMKFLNALDAALLLGLDARYDEIKLMLNPDYPDDESSSDAIGKFVEEKPVKLDPHGRLQGKIRNVDTDESWDLSTIDPGAQRSPPFESEEVRGYIENVEKLLSNPTITIPQKQKELLERIVTQFKANPPKAIVITKAIKAGFFGAGKRDLLVISEDLLSNPISFLHEMIEYLKYVDQEIIDSIKGFLDEDPLPEYDGDRYLGYAGKTWLDSHKEKYAKKAKADVRYKNYFEKNESHYIIRAFTRQVFGEEDGELAGKIKYKQLFDKLEETTTQAHQTSREVEAKCYDVNTLTDISKGMRSVNDHDLGRVIMAGMDEIVLVEVEPMKKAAIFASEHHVCLSCDIRARKGDKAVIGHLHIYPGSSKGSDFDNITGGAFEKYKRMLDFITDTKAGLTDIQIILSPDKRMRGLPSIQEMKAEANARGIQTLTSVERPERIRADSLNTVNDCILRISSTHKIEVDRFITTTWSNGRAATTITSEERQNVWNAVNLLHDSQIEIFVPQHFKQTVKMNQIIGGINRRNKADVINADTINLREYSDGGNLKKMLKGKIPGVRRIIITDGETSQGVEALTKDSPESFRDVRLLNIALPENYQIMEPEPKTRHQARVIMIAILARLLEKDVTPVMKSVREVLMEMLRVHFGDDNDKLRDFVDILCSPEDELTSLKAVGDRVQYFLTSPISLIKEIDQRMRFIKEFWTCA